jgi:hypothetical protein
MPAGRVAGSKLPAALLVCTVRRPRRISVSAQPEPRTGFQSRHRSRESWAPAHRVDINGGAIIDHMSPRERRLVAVQK